MITTRITARCCSAAPRRWASTKSALSTISYSTKTATPSRDQATVAALQQHASEVSDFVKDGIAAMHTAMMKKMSGTMLHVLHGAMMGSQPKAATAPSGR